MRRRHGSHHDMLVAAAAVATLTAVYLAALIFLADPEPTTTEPQQRNVAAQPPRDALNPPSRGYARTAPPRPPAAGPVRATETATSPAPVVSDKPSRGKPAGTGAWPSGLTPVLRCIRQQESDGNYTVVGWYDGHRYGGAYQLDARYSPAWAQRYGHPEVARLTADLWSPATQDDVARELFADWPQVWATWEECA